MHREPMRPQKKFHKRAVGTFIQVVGDQKKFTFINERVSGFQAAVWDEFTVFIHPYLLLYLDKHCWGLITNLFIFLIVPTVHLITVSF